jgi:hypothetical protein
MKCVLLHDVQNIHLFTYILLQYLNFGKMDPTYSVYCVHVRMEQKHFSPFNIWESQSERLIISCLLHPWGFTSR